MPMAILAASVPETPPPMIVTLAAGVPGTPPSRMPAPPAGLSRWWAAAWTASRPATSLIGVSSGSLRSGGLHGLVGDGVDAALEQEVGESAVGGQVQVGEQLLALAEAVVLGRDRLLDLDDQVGAGEHLVGGGDDGGAGRGVLGVGEARTVAGAALDQHPVSVVDELGHPVRLDGDPVLVVLDLLGDTYGQCGHGNSFGRWRSPAPFRAGPRPCILPRGRSVCRSRVCARRAGSRPGRPIVSVGEPCARKGSARVRERGREAQSEAPPQITRCWPVIIAPPGPSRKAA